MPISKGFVQILVFLLYILISSVYLYLSQLGQFIFEVVFKFLNPNISLNSKPIEELRIKNYNSDWIS